MIRIIRDIPNEVKQEMIKEYGEDYPMDEYYRRLTWAALREYKILPGQKSLHKKDNI